MTDPADLADGLIVWWDRNKFTVGWLLGFACGLLLVWLGK